MRGRGKDPERERNRGRDLHRERDRDPERVGQRKDTERSVLRQETAKNQTEVTRKADPPL